jgi:hypothetical protein
MSQVCQKLMPDKVTVWAFKLFSREWAPLNFKCDFDLGGSDIGLGHDNFLDVVDINTKLWETPFMHDKVTVRTQMEWECKGDRQTDRRTVRFYYAALRGD